MRALAVEDDARIAADLQAALEGAGFRVETCPDGEEAWFLGDTEDYDLVVLDLGLPRMDGLSVLKRWRAAGHDMPVLVLTPAAPGPSGSRASRPAPTTTCQSRSAWRSSSPAPARSCAARLGGAAPGSRSATSSSTPTG